MSNQDVYTLVSAESVGYNEIVLEYDTGHDDNLRPLSGRFHPSHPARRFYKGGIKVILDPFRRETEVQFISESTANVFVTTKAAYDKWQQVLNAPATHDDILPR